MGSGGTEVFGSFGSLDEASEKIEIDKDEAFAIAEFIDINIFNAIRTDTEWDSFYNLQYLIHGYEKCCAISGYVGITDKKKGSYQNES